jgi:NADH dehydrogenase
MNGRPKVAIVGGGFAGLEAARALDGKPVDVVLIDARNHHLFTPLLYQVATALLDPSQIAVSLRSLFRRSENVRVVQGHVTEVRPDAGKLATADGTELDYDYLVLATGSETAYFGHSELARHTIGMKSLEQALRLRSHVLAALEHAARARDPERDEWLTFVVVGGGPAGVEYAGALAELLRLVLGQDFPELGPGSARVMILEAGDRPLRMFSARASRYATRRLEKLGVEVRTGSVVEAVTGESVLLADGDVLRTRTVVWTAGVAPTAELMPPELGRSGSRRLVVDEHLRVPGTTNTFAIGDVASVEADGELPMLATPAMQAGRHVARTILADLRKKPLPRFSYRSKGSLATIGRTSAIARFGRFELFGLAAWILWALVHVYYLVGFRSRLFATLTWLSYSLRRDRPVRLVAPADADRLTTPERLASAEA